MSSTLERDDLTAAILGALRSPTRNRYFYGKLLDAHHLRIEQDYVNQMRWLMNRLSLGTGVLCGLRVAVPDKTKNVARIAPGVAVDGLGREIIVPAPTAPFDFVELAKAAKAVTIGAEAAPAMTVPGHSAAIVVDRAFTILLCYHECCVEPMPVLVTDECAPERRCEHGLIRERYAVKVLPGLHLPPEHGFPDLCKILTGNLTREKRLEALCQYRPPIRRRDATEIKRGGDCSPPDEICVPIAAIIQGANKEWAVRPCPPPRLLFSNEVLFEMILCVADCCADHHVPEEPGEPEEPEEPEQPEEPTPPPPVVKPLPYVVDIRPATGTIYRPQQPPSPEVYANWVFEDQWQFTVTFSQKMNPTNVHNDLDKWLRVYLVVPGQMPLTHIAASVSPAVVVRMTVAMETPKASTGVGERHAVGYRIKTPDAAPGVPTTIKNFLDSLKAGTHLDKLPYLRFIIVMHTNGSMPADADGRLLDATCDGIPSFDQPF